MEIWIASGSRKELKKKFPFLREYGVIDIREIAISLGHDTSVGLDDHSSFILNSEIIKRLEAFNNSRRFYRVLFLVEEERESLSADLLNYATENKLKYEAVYQRKGEEFVLVTKNY